MTKPDGVSPAAKDDGVPPFWGTWEELILAFAVNRHGTASWDSIATELQKRTSDPNLPLTAQNCRSKYLDLKRRYVAASAGDSDGGAKSSVDESAAPLLEELRKLRVAELRREVQRYDLNIESLELKVKGMEEEREKKPRRESDLEIKREGEKRDAEPEAELASGGEPVVGEESEKDQSSVNESNSTDPDAARTGTGDEKTEPVGNGSEDGRQDRTGMTREEPAELSSEPDRKSVREDSCNGSSNSIKKSNRKAKTEPEAESDGGGEAAKENSDVQSTASRSRKVEEEEGSDKVRRGNTSGDEREHEDQSQPLFEFLQAIRDRKLGSAFERRLLSQEASIYQKLILQHMDLETVETRLRQGWYSGSNPPPCTKFFRDILLLVNNALVFFPKMSAESKAANEIRALVTREITQKSARSDSSSGKQASLQSLSMSKKPEELDELSKPSMLKPKIPASMVVCRKRSSITAKASSSDKKKELLQKTPLFAAAKENDLRKVPSESEEPKFTKKRTRDNRVPSSSTTPPPNNTTKKTNIKNNNQASNNSNIKQHIGKGGVSSSENQKGDNKKCQPDSKKRGAANFLNRMKQSSLSSNNNNGSLLDALKNTPLVTNDGGKGGSGSSDQKKNDSFVKRGEKKEQVTRSVAETRQVKEKEKEKEKESPGKRNVGRPPKRGAVAVPSTASGKRGRERGEMETPPSGKQQPKKRVRKL